MQHRPRVVRLAQPTGRAIARGANPAYTYSYLRFPGPDASAFLY